MPSPFPGMDPYLEAGNRWPTLHQAFNTMLCFALNARLPNRYVATVALRLYLDEPERQIYPDVDVRLRRPPEPGGGGVAVAEEVAADPAILVESEEVRESFIQIIVPGEEDRVVTVIETLSPSNKAAGSAGRELYRKKQREVLDGPSHLIEIDLLRSGEYTVAAPGGKLSRKARFDYLASLSRAGRREIVEVWPFSIRERFPRILVPLTSDDPDVVLNLQAVFDRCYDEGAFARWIDYRKAPDPGFSGPEDEAWAAGLLREKGLRP